ncbi:hypothetical protein TNCV_1022401 [Trichonephila clavipes]|nr:hypothetical protein TNCV_1022401 [Trichonephila clavipes]
MGKKICSIKVFEDFPTYLSNYGNPTRECPEKRLQRLENEHLQRSIQASIISKEEFEKKKSFTSFPELVECLNAEKLQDIWTVICKNDLVIIMKLDTKISPVIKASVIINKDLDLTIHIGQTKIDQLESSVLHNFNITLSEKDFCDAQPYLPVLTYLARAALKKLKCDFCSKSLVLNKSLELNSNYDFIRNLDRGSLLCPSPDVVTAVLYSYIIVKKLLSNDYENMFLKQNNQRQIASEISILV